ncbi:hypothetical protein P3T25_005055 [Paraburkholderia sp. GAS32]
MTNRLEPTGETLENDPMKKAPNWTGLFLLVLRLHVDVRSRSPGGCLAHPVA